MMWQKPVLAQKELEKPHLVCRLRTACMCVSVWWGGRKCPLICPLLLITGCGSVVLSYLKSRTFSLWCWTCCFSKPLHKSKFTGSVFSGDSQPDHLLRTSLCRALEWHTSNKVRRSPHSLLPLSTHPCSLYCAEKFHMENQLVSVHQGNDSGLLLIQCSAGLINTVTHWVVLQTSRQVLDPDKRRPGWSILSSWQNFSLGNPCKTVFLTNTWWFVVGTGDTTTGPDGKKLIFSASVEMPETNRPPFRLDTILFYASKHRGSFSFRFHYESILLIGSSVPRVEWRGLADKQKGALVSHEETLWKVMGNEVYNGNFRLLVS